MKNSRTYLVLLLLLTLAGSVAGHFLQPSPVKKRAVYGIDYYVSPSAIDYTAAAKRIVGDETRRYDKARRIYLWLCDNVNFDRSGQIRTADETWRSHEAVCQGYCELFYRLGECVGVKSRLVYGKCRRPNGTMEEHVWLSVATEQGDILLDPTWGAGLYRHDRFVRHPEPLRWFDVDPAWFIFSHFPKSSSRQNLPATVSEEQFASLPFVEPPGPTEPPANAQEALSRALGTLHPLPPARPAKALPCPEDVPPSDSLSPDTLLVDSLTT